jgi:hypothetical protein
MTTKSNTKWTTEEDRRLLELKTAGKPYPLIAAALRRSAGSIKARVRLLKSQYRKGQLPLLDLGGATIKTSR